MVIDQNLLPDHLEIVVLLAMGTLLATVFGYLTERMKLSPILGYLMAGYLIGPYSPGFVADHDISEQLAEIGVILMMFGVGLHLRWQELSHVKSIAISGAIAQTSFTTVMGAVLIHGVYGYSLEAAVVLGLSIGIASTVFLARLLSENDLHNKRAGHIAISWLIIEDFIAVIALLLLSTLATLKKGVTPQWGESLADLALVLAKFIVWVLLLFSVGRRLASYVLRKIVVTKSHELFTVATLAITFTIAIGTVTLTGTSIALGAFVAGMVIGQTALRQHVARRLTPLKDVFVVVFFLSIGMLFNPAAIASNFLLFVVLLMIILVGKPLIAWLIVWLMKSSQPTAVTVAIALAQIGEFSFILAEEASKLKVLPDDGFDLIVACAFTSLAINPLLFRWFVRKQSKDAIPSDDEA